MAALAVQWLLWQMKTSRKHLAPVILSLLFIAVGAARTFAYDHDNNGWYDSQHHHHPFVHHGGHRGYWDHDNSGARVFISI